jgi:hypothetical protein
VAFESGLRHLLSTCREEDGHGHGAADANNQSADDVDDGVGKPFGRGRGLDDVVAYETEKDLDGTDLLHDARHAEKPRLEHGCERPDAQSPDGKVTESSGQNEPGAFFGRDVALAFSFGQKSLGPPFS